MLDVLFEKQKLVSPQAQARNISKPEGLRINHKHILLEMKRLCIYNKRMLGPLAR